MKRIFLCLALAVTACGQTQDEIPSDLTGRWDVQEIAGASLGEGVDIWIEIDAHTGAMTGFTGCKPFTASVSGFGQGISVGGVDAAAGECANEAASTDEARFLGVLGSVQRYIRHGRALELLQAQPGTEALLNLRLEDEGG